MVYNLAITAVYWCIPAELSLTPRWHHQVVTGGQWDTVYCWPGTWEPDTEATVSRQWPLSHPAPGVTPLTSDPINNYPINYHWSHSAKFEFCIIVLTLPMKTVYWLICAPLMAQNFFSFPWLITPVIDVLVWPRPAPSQSGLTTAPPLSLHSLVTNSWRCQLLLLQISIAIYATIFLTTKA